MAVNRMGFNLVRSVAVAFAIRQLRVRHAYSGAVRAEIETAWRDSIKVASVCYLLAKHCTHLNPDQALLAGLLHVVGRLYVAVRAAAFDGFEDDTALEQLTPWRGRIGKAILEGWGLPEALQHAVEHQDDADYMSDEVSLTTVLIGAKLLADGSADARCPALERIAAAKAKDPAATLAERADELRELRGSLGE